MSEPAERDELFEEDARPERSADETLIVDAYELGDGGRVTRFASVESLLVMKRAANRRKDQEGIAKFGDAYRKYERRTGKWLPWVGRKG